VGYLLVRETSYFEPFVGSPWITVGERERTHALHGEMLYPTAFSAASSASVGAPQVPHGMREFSLPLYVICVLCIINALGC